MSSKITRKAGRKQWVIIDKTAAHDASLSWKAKGLLLYMLSMPDDWSFYVSELKSHATDGRDSTASGLKELEKAGYLVKTKRRDSKGKFQGYDYNLFETPLPENGKPENGNPENGKPETNKDLLKLSTDNTKKEEAIENCNTPFDERMKKFGFEIQSPTEEEFNKFKKEAEKEKNSAKKEKIEDLEYYQETIQILALFTELTKAKFKPPKKLSSFKRYGAYKMIKGLLKQGFKLRELEDVIRFKCKEWLHSAKMARHCTYKCILLPSNFENYITQIQIKPQTNGNQANNTNKEKTITDIFAEIDERYKQEGFDSADFGQSTGPF